MNATTQQQHFTDTPDAVDTSPPRRWTIPKCPIPIFVALLLGVVLRVAWLNEKPLWEDEAWSFVTAVSHRPLLDICAADPHPLSFYWVTRHLPAWFLSSDWAFRLPQAFASCIALLLLPGVFRRWLRPSLAYGPAPPDASTTGPFSSQSIESLIRWCVLVFALLPLNVRYAQDARAYAYCQLAGVLVLLAYFECRRRPTWPMLLALTIVTAISMHIDGFGWITPFAVGVHALLGVRRREVRRTIGALVGGGLLAVPYVWFRAVHMMAAGEMHAVGSGRIEMAFAARWLELSPIGFAFSPIPSKYHFVIWGVSAITAIVFLIGMATSVWCRRDDRRWFSLLLFALPFALLTLLSIAVGEIFIFRKYLIPTVPAVALLFSLGFLRVTRGSLVSALIVLLLVPLGVSAVSNVRDGDRADWRGLYQKMQSHIEPGDVFTQARHLNYPEYSFGPLRAYAWRDNRNIDASRFFEFTDWNDAPQTIDEFAATAGADRIWAVTTHWMAKNRSPDLSAFADKAAEYKARGCRATLWEVRRADQ